MIDSVHSLMFSIQANPGVYSIFLGSSASIVNAVLRRIEEWR